MNRSAGLRALLRRTRGDRLDRVCDPPHAGLGLLRLEDGLDIFALVRVAQVRPAIPRGWGALERLHEVGGRLHLAVGVELERDVERLAAFEARRLAVAPAQRNARAVAHRRDRAPGGVAVQL